MTKRHENNCSNCSRRRTCKFGRGVVVWKHCDRFKAKKNATDLEKLEKVP